MVSTVQLMMLLASPALAFVNSEGHQQYPRERGHYNYWYYTSSVVPVPVVSIPVVPVPMAPVPVVADVFSEGHQQYQHNSGPGGAVNPIVACRGGWPHFESEQALRNDPWANYFEMVYGALPAFTYPLCIGDFWYFNDAYIEKVGASVPPLIQQQATYRPDDQSAWLCPSYFLNEGDHYTQNNMYQRSGISWSWHTPPSNYYSANTWVEVDHMSDPFSDEQYGLWLLIAKGSGVWFNTGNTIGFEEHWDGEQYFGVASSDTSNQDVSKSAADRGYDSIQYSGHRDNINYPCADTAVGGSWMNFEIVAVKLTGTFACGHEEGARGFFRAGWQASRECHCDNYGAEHWGNGVYSAKVYHGLNCGPTSNRLTSNPQPDHPDDSPTFNGESDHVVV